MTSKAKKKSDIHKLQHRVLLLEETNEAKVRDMVDVWEAIEADGRAIEKHHYKIYRNTNDLNKQQDIIDDLVVEMHNIKAKLASIDGNSAKPLNFDLTEDDEWLNLDIDTDRRHGCDCPWCANGVGEERIHD